VPLDELFDWPIDRTPVFVVFPYESARAATPGDPSKHLLGAAVDLLRLATSRLTERFGDPDFPSAEAPMPDWLSRDAVAAVAWDFDCYQLLLELQELHDPLRPRYSIRYRKRTN
jgi:hypothetical protein